MKHIGLTQGRQAIVDDEDYEWLSQWKWLLFPMDRYYYAARFSRDTFILMHRLLLDIPTGKVCDHINHDGLDNRRCNIRICTIADNLRNSKSRGGSSQYKGVYWSKQNKAWVAQIKYNYTMYYLGKYKDEDKAAIAYNTGALELFGEYAYLNEIKDNGHKKGE